VEKTPSIIIIEDHPVMRAGLVSYFTGTRRWKISGAVSNVEDAKILLSGPYKRKHKYGNTDALNTNADIVLIDIQLENGWGLDIIPWLKDQQKTRGTMPVLAVYSYYDDFAHVSAAMTMGVRAYVCKRRSERELENALLKALDGKIFIDETIQEKFLLNTELIMEFTKREIEVFSLVKSQFTNGQIASRLGLSRRTIENILCSIYDKTGINSRLELQTM